MLSPHDCMNKKSKAQAMDHPIETNKNLHGNSNSVAVVFGASGGIELIACALSIRDSKVHPTTNLSTPDPNCDLDYVPNVARDAKVRYAISNSFGFGGHNCCLALGAV